MTPDDFKDGDAIVCNRGEREIGGFKKGNILAHRRLPCGFVSFTHCTDFRPATQFERRMMTEMDVGLYVRIIRDDGDINGPHGFGVPDSQW